MSTSERCKSFTRWS